MHRHVSALFLAAVTLALPVAPALAQSPAYDVSQLNPQVQAAVIEARAAEARATSAAAMGRDAAQRGQAAAVRARSGATGTHSQTLSWGDPPRTAVYETEFVNNQRNGYGVQTFTAGPWVGDSYAGQYRDDTKAGYGVMTRAVNDQNSDANNSVPLDRYEGEFANAYGNGVGVLIWRDTETYAGAVQTDTQQGAGVYRFRDGRRWEGQWIGGAFVGLGVKWDASGGIESQGVYSGGQLTTALTR